MIFKQRKKESMQSQRETVAKIKIDEEKKKETECKGK